VIWGGPHGGLSDIGRIKPQRSVKLKAVLDTINKVCSTIPSNTLTPAPARGSVAQHPYTDTTAHIRDTCALGCASVLTAD